jgi:hypothetical protein
MDIENIEIKELPRQPKDRRKEVAILIPERRKIQRRKKVSN